MTTPSTRARGLGPSSCTAPLCSDTQYLAFVLGFSVVWRSFSYQVSCSIQTPYNIVNVVKIAGSKLCELIIINNNNKMGRRSLSAKMEGYEAASVELSVRLQHM